MSFAVEQQPKVNYTLVKGNHSIKLGWEMQKVWMDVQDTNPLYC